MPNQEVMIENDFLGHVVKIGRNFHNLISSQEIEAVFVYLHQSEKESTLYGFQNWDCRTLFLLLISVSGVGPKTALNIVDSAAPSQILEAVLSKNFHFFSAFAGIGEKTAKKLILELENKTDKVELTGTDINFVKTEENNSGESLDMRKDLISALVNLGYSRLVAAKTANKHFHKDEDLDTNLKNCLRDLRN